MVNRSSWRIFAAATDTTATGPADANMVASNGIAVKQANDGKGDVEKVLSIARQIVESWPNVRDRVQQHQMKNGSPHPSSSNANLEGFNSLISSLDQLTVKAQAHNTLKTLPTSKDRAPQLQRFLEENNEWERPSVEHDPSSGVPFSETAGRPASPSASSYSFVADSAISTAVSDETVVLDTSAIQARQKARQHMDEATLHDLNEKLCRIVTSGQPTKGIIARATDLIDAGADVNGLDVWCDGVVYDRLWKDWHGGLGRDRLPATVLYAAVASEADCDVIRLLLNKGADINKRGGFSGYPLQAIVTTDEKDIVRLLLNRGAKVDPPQAGYGRTTLNTAARYGARGIVELLLDRGANIMEMDNTHATALHNAAHRGHVGLIKLLLDRGADIDAKRTEDDATPLSDAIRMAHVRSVRVLLARGADVRQLPRVQMTYAESMRRDPIVDLLGKYGAEYTCSGPDIPRTSGGSTPIYELILEGYTKPISPPEEILAPQYKDPPVVGKGSSAENEPAFPGYQKVMDESQARQNATPDSSSKQAEKEEDEETRSVVSFQTTTSTATAKTEKSRRKKFWSRFSSQTTLHDNT